MDYGMRGMLHASFDFGEVHELVGFNIRFNIWVMEEEYCQGIQAGPKHGWKQSKVIEEVERINQFRLTNMQLSSILLNGKKSTCSVYDGSFEERVWILFTIVILTNVMRSACPHAFSSCIIILRFPIHNAISYIKCNQKHIRIFSHNRLYAKIPSLFIELNHSIHLHRPACYNILHDLFFAFFVFFPGAVALTS